MTDLQRGPTASILDLASTSATGSLELVGGLSSAVDGSVRVIVLRGCLPEGAWDPTAWSRALFGLQRASQVTIGVLAGAPSADDAALHLLCDVVLCSATAELQRWKGHLAPPSVSARQGGLAAWAEPGPWSALRAFSAGLVHEVVPAAGIENRLGEWLEELASWDFGRLSELRALSRLAHNAAMTEAINGWVEARERDV